MTTETIKELNYKVCEAVGKVLMDYYHQNDGDNQKHIYASEDITQAALEALGFDALLEEHEALRRENARIYRLFDDYMEKMKDMYEAHMERERQQWN